MKRYNRLFKKSICFFLAAVMVATSVGANALAANGQPIRGTYHISSAEGGNKQTEDTFEYYDEYFQKSSYEDNKYLTTLSIQLAASSIARYGDGEDPYDVDYTNNDQNVKEMLTNMGFEHYASNAWYHQEKQPNSIGVAIASKTITVGDKNYTLLAIVPRSAGYKQEWAGNMIVGSGGIHEGFKAARDEALRFAKKYIADNNITGDIKVYTVGYSRGGAVSNQIAGFLADGGAEYLGNVTLSPEDIYCYTYGTPRSIKDGASKDTVLSVSGKRDGKYAAYDTDGDEWTYTGGGNVDLLSDVFKGIRAYTFEYDMVTRLALALEGWDFDIYGSRHNSYGDATESQMLAELRSLSERVYTMYVGDGESNPGGPTYFKEKTFDIPSLSLKDVEGGSSGTSGMATFITGRLSALWSLVRTNGEYASSGYQATISSLLAIVGMLSPFLSLSDDSQPANDESESPVSGKLMEYFGQPVIISVLAYASEKLQGEGAESEDKAVALALVDLLEYIDDDGHIDLDTFKVDDFFAMITQYVADHPDSALTKKIVDGITSKVPEQYAGIARSFLANFYPGGATQETTLGDIAFQFIKACAYGAADDAPIVQDHPEYLNDPTKVRGFLYSLVGMMSVLGVLSDEIATAIDSGNGSFQGFVSVILKIFRKKDSSTKEDPKYYDDLAQAADEELVQGLDKYETDIFNLINQKGLHYDAEFISDAHAHFATIRNNISYTRTLLMTLLLDTGGDYNTGKILNTVGTFAGMANKVMPAHLDEVFISWAKANSKEAPPPSPSPSPKPKPEPTPTPIPESDNVIDYDEEAGIATVVDEVEDDARIVPIYVIQAGQVYRMYDPNRGEHFFTKDPVEVAELEKLGWVHETGSDFGVISATDVDAVPVYRLYNPYDGGMHFYTKDANEARVLKDRGYSYEGISYYAYQSSSEKGINQYRLYNPNSPIGLHLWTMDIRECDALIKAGWRDEGICWKVA